MNFIFWVIVKMALAAAISYAVIVLTKQKPEDITYDPDHFKNPEVREGTKFPIIAGTCWIENPVVGWFGDISTESVRVRLSHTGGQNVYVNRYSYGALLILAQGVCDGVLQIRVDKDVIWPSEGQYKVLSADGVTTDYILLPELYGGLHEHNAAITGEGGLWGTIRFRYGEITQLQDAYIVLQCGTGISADRGLTSIVFLMQIGHSTQMRQWKYLLKRTDVLTTGEAQWYPLKAAIRTYEINPIHWLREIYTDTEWGLGTSTSLVNNANLEAAADTLYDEGFGICIKWEGDQSLEAHVKDVLRYINAVIYEDHLTGMLEIKLIRDDYVIGDLEVFDETDIINIESFSRGTIHKIPDVTYLKYWDMYNNIPVTTANHDMALIAMQAEMLVPNESEYTGIVNDDLAGRIAARDQHQLGVFAAQIKIKCKRTMAHLNPGDVFNLSYESRGIVSMAVRVLACHYGTLVDGAVSFDCIEDMFGMKDSLYGTPPSTGWDDFIDDPTYTEEITKANMALTGVDPTVAVTSSSSSSLSSSSHSSSSHSSSSSSISSSSSSVSSSHSSSSHSSSSSSVSSSHSSSSSSG